MVAIQEIRVESPAPNKLTISRVASGRVKAFGFVAVMLAALVTYGVTELVSDDAAVEAPAFVTDEVLVDYINSLPGGP
jgi:hypothetical protein